MNDKTRDVLNRALRAEPASVLRRFRRPLCVALIVAGAAALTVAADQDGPRPASPRAGQREFAVQAFRAQRYATAYGRFAQLADAGDAPSALIALAMVRHGPSLFGSEWSATPGQLRRWSAMAIEDVRDRGFPIAEHDRGE
jgi:hypothetical protein